MRERDWARRRSDAIVTADGTVTRSEVAKGAVIRSVTDRLTAPLDRLLAAGAEPHVPQALLRHLGDSDYVVALRNPEHPSMGGMVLHRSAIDATNPAHSPHHLLPLDAEGAPRLVREMAVSELIMAWAHDSNGTNVRSLAIQEAARSEFGLGEVLDWPMSDGLWERVHQEVAAHGDVHRELLRVQYELTLAELNRRGVSGLVLYRGYSWPEATRPDWSRQPPGSIIEMPPQRPLSAWTGDRRIAEEWIGGLQDPGVIIAARFPVEAILAYPQTGIGCLWQREFVVLAGRGTATLDVAYPDPAVPPSSVVRDLLSDMESPHQPITAVEVPGSELHGPDARQALAQLDGRDGAATVLRATDVDDAMAQATQSRTPEGLVDNTVVASLIDSLPTIDPTRTGDVALVVFVSEALGQEASLSRVGGTGAKGRSGAPVYLVRGESDEVVAIAKIFPKAEEFVRELSSLERLRSREFTRFTVPDPLAVGVIHTLEGPAGVLVSAVAAGRPIDDIIADAGQSQGAEREQRLAVLSQAVADTATALAELHTRPEGSGRPVAGSYLNFHTALARRLADAVLADRFLYEDLGGLRVDELSRRVDDAIVASRRDPGRAALVHGDAHPGNFFWDPSRGVTFIDTPTFHYSVDDHGNPIASPERDVSNFEQRLAHYGRVFHLASDEVGRLHETFISSYRAAGGAEPNGDTLRMFAARSVLNKLLQIGEEVREKLDEASDPGGRHSVDLTDLRAEIELLRRSLGWEE